MAATAQERFSIADRVIHPGKPEWGVGTVASASSTTQDGVPCQRLAIRFDRAGLKTITTAFVTLKRVYADQPAAEPKVGVDPARPEAPDPFAAARSGASGMPIPDDPRAVRKLMTAVPDDATDPFISEANRLRKVLGLYRFQPTPGSLIDWAAAQSGLADPLTRFSRHELEEFFREFRRNLDKALAKAVGDASRVDPAELREIARAAPPDGQRALQALHRKR
ncbi:MAG: DUF3553 domain-containing protein [Planctomycetota bacterium]|nr:MAG: DUF3553 domain-containing protein [Planctomycetota bacterium]